ncbi:MAG TPA: HAD hydrolase-like protein, partial [Gemmatimonadaceae bacterium]|nr:HAD hydrolase-like protein [Gemmatimonadaceae bacterium]
MSGIGSANGTTTVVLFDIDGTILWSDGAGRRAVTTALQEVFGSTGPAGHRFDGKTDRQIVRELMNLAGHADEHIDEQMERVMERYLEELREELRHPDHPPQRFAGVVELLDALEARHDVVLGLLTGNLEEGAHEKLRVVGIDPARFRVNAYGSDAENRPDLPPVAHRRACELLGVSLPGERFVVIGDTPADMTCGRGIGARAIGVATGRYTT